MWTETPQGGAVNFITGAGGFLQSILFGWGGIRILENQLFVNPTLPPNTSSMTIRGVHFLDGVLDIKFDNSSVTITGVDIKSPVAIKFQSFGSPITTGSWTRIKLQDFTIVSDS